MDRRERNSSATEAMLAAFQGLKTEIWNALPGQIVSWDPAKMTVVVQPTIQALWRDPLGNQSWQTMPLCLDVPVIYPSGGGCTITFPLVAGDECLLIFSSRCIDAWWQSGGVNVQAELRMHDLSDGFCLPGPRSQPRVLSGISTSSLQIRSDDGAAFIELETGGSHAVTVQTSGSATVTASEATINCNVTINGDLDVSGAITATGKLTASDVKTTTMTSLNVHRHTGVIPGGGTSGPPAP